MGTYRHKETGKRFLLVHIPRTGGRFISVNLEQNGWEMEPIDYCGIPHYQHSVIDDCEIAHFYRELYEKHCDIEGIPQVAVIRNPINRFISGSMYIKRKYGDDIQELMEDEMYFYSMLDNMPVKESVNWYRPMVDFMTEKTNIWRFEDGFGDDFVSWLSGIVGIDLEFTDDVEYAVAPDEGNKLEKTPQLIDTLIHFYKQDIEQFYPELAA